MLPLWKTASDQIVHEETARMIQFKDGNYEIGTATADEEIKQLGKAGFQKYDERRLGQVCISYYRKPKRFSSYG